MLKIKDFYYRFSKVPVQRLVAFLLVFVSLSILLMSFRLNFDQNALFTQVVHVDNNGIEEISVFRDYRSQEADRIYKVFSECLQINEMFGDGTGDECDELEQQYSCVKETVDLQSLLAC